MMGFREFIEGETGPLQYAARGELRIHGTGVKQGLEVVLQLRTGWHVNGPEPRQDLIPTRVSLGEPARGWAIGSVNYPPPEIVTLPFSKEPLPLYRHRVAFMLPVLRFGAGPAPIQIRLQACDEKHCLAPEQQNLHIPGFKKSR